MKHAIQIGLNFGATSGIITTIGLITGLHASTYSKIVVIGGILTIAVADACSDALGIHMAEEAECVHTHAQVWLSTIMTFLCKFIVTITFIIPFLIFELGSAVNAALIWGLLLLSLVNYKMAKEQNIKPWKVILEHSSIAIIVVIATHHLGKWISNFF